MTQLCSQSNTQDKQVVSDMYHPGGNICRPTCNHQYISYRTNRFPGSDSQTLLQGNAIFITTATNVDSRNNLSTYRSELSVYT